jgi:hypothetical protein
MMDLEFQEDEYCSDHHQNDRNQWRAKNSQSQKSQRYQRRADDGEYERRMVEVREYCEYSGQEQHAVEVRIADNGKK